MKIILNRYFLFVGLALFIAVSVNAQVNNAVTYSNPTASQSTEYRNGNIYQKDFLLFVEMLKETHPAFASGSDDPLDIDSVKICRI